jgi:hypothetical protein
MTEETPKAPRTRKPRVEAEAPVAAEPTTPAAWTPTPDVFINLKGKMYLPARRRVQWMRGEPVPHPDWTIDTEIVEHRAGKRVSPMKVEDGYAIVRANIYDETGRLISTGLKSEYSENFMDYLEKAETGAVARAAALAGYGTESALDLDEGVDGGRIADSPVAPAVTASSVGGVGRGGHTGLANESQIREVARLSRALVLSAEAILAIASRHTTVPMPELPADPSAQGPVMKELFEQMKSEEIGAVISELRMFVPPDEAVEE